MHWLLLSFLPGQILGQKKSTPHKSKTKLEKEKGSLADDDGHVHASDMAAEERMWLCVGTLIFLALPCVLQEVLPLNFFSKHSSVYAEIFHCLDAGQLVAFTPEYELLMQAVKDRITTVPLIEAGSSPITLPASFRT